MSLDLACLAVVVLAAIGGAWIGAMAQIAPAVSVAAGYLGARWLAADVAPLLQGRVPAFAAHPLATVGTFIACTLAVRLLFLLTPLRRASGTGADRGLGALLAAAQAALVAWVAISALASWGKPVRLGPLVLDPAESELAGLARQLGAPGTAGARPRR